MFQIVRLADFFITHGVGVVLLVKITIYIASAFLPVVLPVSFLVAVLVGFGRMSADSEIVAFKAAGFSLRQLYAPVFFLSIIVCVCMTYLTNYFIPWGNRELKRTLVKLGDTKVVANLKEGVFTEGFFDLLIYTDKVDVSKNKLSGVFIYDERDTKNPMVVVSKEGIVIPLKSQSEIGSSAILKLNEGSIHRTDISRNYYEKINFNEYRLKLKVEEGNVHDITYPKTLESPILKSFIEKYLKENDPRHIEYALEYWKRIAFSITPILFGFLGVGLGVVRSRSVKSNAVFVALGVILVYWTLHVAGAYFSEKAYLPPFLAMELSNFVIIPLAFLSFRKSNW